VACAGAGIWQERARGNAIRYPPFHPPAQRKGARISGLLIHCRVELRAAKGVWSMDTGEQDIIEILDRVDDLFRELPGVSEQALTLWEQGMERLSGALWLYEKGAKEE
jgi:hypothetical protein